MACIVCSDSESHPEDDDFAGIVPPRTVSKRGRSRNKQKKGAAGKANAKAVARRSSSPKLPAKKRASRKAKLEPATAAPVANGPNSSVFVDGPSSELPCV